MIDVFFFDTLFDLSLIDDQKWPAHASAPLKMVLNEPPSAAVFVALASGTRVVDPAKKADSLRGPPKRD